MVFNFCISNETSMPMCVESYSPSDNDSALVRIPPPLRLKTTTRRFCCGYVPYSFQNLTKLRKILENEYAATGQESRKSLSLVNGLQPAELATVIGLLSGIHRAQGPNDMENAYAIECGCCQRIKLYELIFGCDEEENFDFESMTPTPFHVVCILPNPGYLINCIASRGADINVANKLGQTPLHVLILGAVVNDNIDDAIACLLSNGASICVTDNAGETPLLYVRNLLQRYFFSRAAHVAGRLIQAGANANHINGDLRTLLAYSIRNLDDSFDLTKLLLNNGCSIWGADSLGSTSAFTWLLDALMKKRKMVNCEKTLSYVGELMQSQPTRMKHFVGRVMISHSKCYQVYGQLFGEIKTAMEVYWKAPMSLLQLSRSCIRNTIDENAQHFVNNTNIPAPLKSYILYDSWPYRD